MATKKIILGLIGCGYWGKNYVKTLRKIDNVNLKWICDKNLDEKNEIISGSLFTNDYNKVIEDKEVNAVIIATPPKTHYEIAKYAIENEKDVLVEKPITCDSKEAYELYELSEKNSRILMTGHIFLYNPAIRKLKEVLGKDIFYFYSRRSGPGPILEDTNCMWNLAPHDISIMNYITGEFPKRVSAKGLTYIKEGVEDVVDLTLEYSNISGIIHLSWFEPRKIREIDFVGKDKKFIFDDLSSDKLKMIENNKESIIETENKEPLTEECQAFIDSIISRKKPLSDGYNGYVITKILESADESLKNSGIFMEVKI